jgi:hypothetical protein
MSDELPNLAWVDEEVNALGERRFVVRTAREFKKVVYVGYNGPVHTWRTDKVSIHRWRWWADRSARRWNRRYARDTWRLNTATSLNDG